MSKVGTVLALLALIIVGLVFVDWAQQKNSPKSEMNVNSQSSYLKKIILEGCEYWVYDCGLGSQRVYSFTHSGTCNNPIHKGEKK